MCYKFVVDLFFFYILMFLFTWSLFACVLLKGMKNPDRIDKAAIGLISFSPGLFWPATGFVALIALVGYVLVCGVEYLIETRKD